MAVEPSLRTKFRRALEVAVAAHFKAAGDEIPFEGGEIGGPQLDRDVGCVWFEGKRRSGRDGNNEEAIFHVRVLRLFQHDQGGETPRVDTEERLERTFEMLEDALVAVLARPWLEAASEIDLDGWSDFFTVTEMTKSTLQAYVQADITAWARNRTAAGG